jgi:hypothetical protein
VADDVPQPDEAMPLGEGASTAKASDLVIFTYRQRRADEPARRARNREQARAGRRVWSICAGWCRSTRTTSRAGAQCQRILDRRRRPPQRRRGRGRDHRDRRGRVTARGRSSAWSAWTPTRRWRVRRSW